MRKIFIAILCIVSADCFSQSLNNLNKIDTDAQYCADTTQDVVACENLHYNQMDNMLNLVFKKLKNISKAGDFKKIKNDQIKWLSIRDKRFKKIESENDCNAALDICQALLISKKTWVVHQRVEVLIKKIPYTSLSKK